MIILEPNEVCPYFNKCCNTSTLFICQGAQPERDNTFVCTLNFDNCDKKNENIQRNVHDKTGKMEILNE